MQKLTDKQEAFALAYAANGGNGTQAAVAAGYSEKSAHVEQNRLLKLTHVQQRIKDHCSDQFVHHAPMAIATLAELARSSRSALVRYNAAKDIADRAGFKPPEKVLELSGTIDLDEHEMRERIETLMSELYPRDKEAVTFDPRSD